MNEDVVAAAIRVVRDYENGVPPHCDDLWIIQLSVAQRDAEDLLLGHEDLARKIVGRHGPPPKLRVASANGGY